MTQQIKYILLGLTLLCVMHSAFGQQRKIDSLLILLKNDNENASKVTHLNKLGDEYRKIGNYDSTMSYCKTALQLAQQLNYKEGIANSYNIIGIVYYLRSDYLNTLEYWLKALEIDHVILSEAKTLPDKQSAMSGMTKRLSNIGIAYEAQGNYTTALNYYFNVLKIDEELATSTDESISKAGKNGVAVDLGNIGALYSNQNDFSKALDYYFKALKIKEELRDKGGVEINLHRIGIIYTIMVDYNKALDYYLKALKIAEEMDHKDGMAGLLGDIGILYKKQGDYTKSLKYYFKSLQIFEELGNRNSIAATHGNIGLLYTTIGRFKEAEEYLKKAIIISESIGAKKELMDQHIYLSNLYDTTGMYKFALIHYKKAVELKDTLFSQENKKQLVRKEMNYEFDKKEALAKAEQEKKDAVTAEEKRKQKIIIYSVSGGLFLVLLLALFIFKGYRQKQRANKELADKNILIEKSKHIIEEKNKDITDSINYAKRIQRAMLPHRRDIWGAFPQSFVLFKPKDIVSGDFYFFHKNNESAFIAACDCTGHGVPGAFMSMVGAGKLNDAVSASSDTSEILSLLNKGVKIALKQSEEDEKATRDGMDLALCSVDMETRIVKYAGANRPIWIIRSGQTAVEEIKATKKAIGGFTEDGQHYDTHEIKLQQGDTFYLSTDGFADTFGGQDQKKVTTKRFKEILLSIQDKTMKEQEQHLDSFIEKWKGGTEQIDDILVIGVRL